MGTGTRGEADRDSAKVQIGAELLCKSAKVKTISGPRSRASGLGCRSSGAGSGLGPEPETPLPWVGSGLRHDIAALGRVERPRSTAFAAGRTMVGSGLAKLIG